MGLDDVHATISASCGTAPRRSAVPATLTKIPQHVGDERSDPVIVEPCRVGGCNPGDERTAELCELGQRHLAESPLDDEGPLAGPSNREALRLQLPVSLQHRIRVDRKLRDHVPDLGQLVTELEVAEPKRVLDLVDELQVGWHPRSEVKAELDRRDSRQNHGFAVLFIYFHMTRPQKCESLSTARRQTGTRLAVLASLHHPKAVGLHCVELGRHVVDLREEIAAAVVDESKPEA